MREEALLRTVLIVADLLSIYMRNLDIPLAALVTDSTKKEHMFHSQICAPEI